jgi:hypothetical protein
VASVLDGYSLKARYLPALVVVLPAWLAFAAWSPPDKQFLGVFASAGVTVVLSTLLGQLGRDAGKARQKELFKEWGGAPTVRALSYRSGVVNHVTLARCHQALMALIPGLQLPADKYEEKANWAAAKRQYVSASDYLREATRDKVKFRLVYAENVNYGFRRNLWGMKWCGVAIAALGALAVGFHAYRHYFEDKIVSGIDAAALILSVTLLTLWLVRFTKAWVRTAADEYSSRIVAAAEILGRDAEARIGRV